MVAYHESGHALLHYFLKNADPAPQGHHHPPRPRPRLVFSLPEDDAYSRNSGWLLDRITIAMGGYAAEKLMLNETTTGAQNDLEQATELARKMVCEWGMSDLLGPIAYGQKDEPIFLGKEIARHKDYSEETARAIDTEIKRIVESSLADAERILSEQKDKLKLLAETLLVKENLDDDEIRALLGFPARKRGEMEPSGFRGSPHGRPGRRIALTAVPCRYSGKSEKARYFSADTLGAPCLCAGTMSLHAQAAAAPSRAQADAFLSQARPLSRPDPSTVPARCCSRRSTWHLTIPKPCTCARRRRWRTAPRHGRR